MNTLAVPPAPPAPPFAEPRFVRLRDEGTDPPPPPTDCALIPGTLFPVVEIVPELTT